jgi:hypothetical protein
MKVNLCFEYKRKSQNSQDSILKQKTFEKSIVLQPENNDVFVEINFDDSLIGFTNMSSEEDEVYIFIEINKQRIFNPKINNYCHFLVKLKDIVNKKDSTLKIQNIFTISFELVFFKSTNETIIKNNDSNNNNNKKENENKKEKENEKEKEKESEKKNEKEKENEKEK